MARPSSDSGFTLLELLVTLSLLGLLTMVMFGGMRFGVQVWARTGTYLNASNAARKAEYLIKTELARAYPLYASNGTTAEIAFDGEPNRVRYLTSSRATPGALESVILEAKQNGNGVALNRTSATELEQPKEPKETPLLGGLLGVGFSYFGASESGKDPAWHEAWRHKTRLPTLIRVVVEATNGTHEFVVAPRLAADAGCVFDALTKNCRGR